MMKQDKLIRAVLSLPFFRRPSQGFHRMQYLSTAVLYRHVHAYEESSSVDERRLVARLPDPCILRTWCWSSWKRLPWYPDTQQVYGFLPLACVGKKKRHTGRRGGRQTLWQKQRFSWESWIFFPQAAHGPIGPILPMVQRPILPILHCVPCV